MINPKAIALEHKFTTVDVAWHDYGGWVVTVHGRATGEFGCNVGSGADPESALADALNKVRNYREDRAAIAAGNRAAKAKRIADIKARSEEHTSEIQALMSNSDAVLCLKKKQQHTHRMT